MRPTPPGRTAQVDVSRAITAVEAEDDAPSLLTALKSAVVYKSIDKEAVRQILGFVDTQLERVVRELINNCVDPDLQNRADGLLEAREWLNGFCIDWDLK
jgi:hypothetical protein